MKFLVDECLHTSLVQLCFDRGHEGYHVNYLGLNGKPDHFLMPRIIDETLTFVTNNARDFYKLFALEPVHAGLVVLLPNVPPPQQVILLKAVFQELEDHGQMFNEALEASFDGDETLERFPPDLSRGGDSHGRADLIHGVGWMEAGMDGQAVVDGSAVAGADRG